jgi:hypothetical protein
MKPANAMRRDEEPHITRHVITGLVPVVSIG